MLVPFLTIDVLTKRQDLHSSLERRDFELEFYRINSHQIDFTVVRRPEEPLFGLPRVVHFHETAHRHVLAVRDLQQCFPLRVVVKVLVEVKLFVAMLKD